jgi:hypothetical protein
MKERVKYLIFMGTGQKVGNYHVSTLRLPLTNPLFGNLGSKPVIGCMLAVCQICLTCVLLFVDDEDLVR